MEAKDLFQKHTLACLAGGFALGVIVLGIGAAFNSISGSPEFCGTCHAMKGEAASFKESSHKNQQCVECHLPHDNVVVYYVEKGRTGMVDTYHELLRDYPAHIKLSEYQAVGGGPADGEWQLPALPRCHHGRGACQGRGHGQRRRLPEVPQPYRTRLQSS